MLQAKNSRRSASAINPVCMEIWMIPVTNIGKPLSNTLGCNGTQRRTKYKVHDVCIVCTAVFQMTPVRLKSSAVRFA